MGTPIWIATVYVRQPRIDISPDGSVHRQVAYRATHKAVIGSAYLGAVLTLGHRDALQSWRDRDENTVKAPATRAGPVLAAAHSEAGEGRGIPLAGKPRAEPGRMGGRRSAGLA